MDETAADDKGLWHRDGRDLRIAALGDGGRGKGIKIMLLAKLWKSFAKLEASSKGVHSLMSQTLTKLKMEGGNEAEIRPFRVAVKFKE